MLPRRAVLVALLCGSVAVVAPALASAPRVDVAGSYTSNWGDVELTQRGNRIRGTYVCCGGGTIEGTLHNNGTIHFRWRQPDGEGRGVWTVDANGGLEGTWGWDQSASDGGPWNLARAKAELAN